MALFKAVLWGTSQEVRNILDNRDLPVDENWTDYALLINALKRKRSAIVKILLDRGCRTRKIPRIDSSDTPLHYAIKMGNIEIVKLLLNKGASVSDVDQNNETPLCYAMKKENLEIIDLLLSSSDFVDINTCNNDGLSHFHIACMRNNASLAENFIKHGANVNSCVNFDVKQWAGYTPLHFAVECNSIEVLQLLLNYKANINIKNGKNMTPLHLALEKQNDVIIDMILSMCNDCTENCKDDKGLSHFHIACMKNHIEAVKNLLKFGIDINHFVQFISPVWAGFTPLHFAVQDLSLSCNSRIPLIELLLSHKANVNAVDVQGQTPLHLACLQSDKKILKIVSNVTKTFENHLDNEEQILDQLHKEVNQIQQIEVVELLLKYKSNVDAENISGETPLFYLYKNDRKELRNKIKHDCIFAVANKALNLKRKDIFKMLVDYNADINICIDEKQSILHTIASISKNCNDNYKEEIAELVLKKGFNINTETKYNSTPLHIAAKNGHEKLVELFLKYGANIDALDDYSIQSTPLHLATSNQQVETINVLLKNNADVTIENRNGMNVLHIMAMINPEISEEPEFIVYYDKIVKTFIEKGCDINSQDISGKTPLHLASWDHNNAATWILMQHFADINIVDYHGESVLAFPVNGTRRCLNISCMFKDYINLLKFTGLHVSDKINEIYLRLFGDNMLDPNDDFLVQCAEEIQKMKDVTLKTNCSLYDILFKSADEMEIHANNEQFTKILNSENFDNEFNIYGNYLRLQYRKGLIKRNILKDAKESFEFMTKTRLPDNCYEKIFQFLDDKSLSDFIKAQCVELSIEKASTKLPVSNVQNPGIQEAIAYMLELQRIHDHR